MVNYLPQVQIMHLILFQFVVLVVILSNLLLLHRSRKHTPPVDFPMVSILVPARNEEKNIGRCIQSLLAQDYPYYEVLVLDDQSNDSTLVILKELAISQPKLKVLAGSVPPDDRSGKNWACSQLAHRARGDLLFFTDADTVHQPQTLRATVTAMLGEQADLLTGFPTQQILTCGERFLVPFFLWASLCFTPLWLAYRLRLQALVVAVGQVMLFRREAYQLIGGHDSLGTTIVDDLMLARKIKAAGLCWRVVSISDLISCRMYYGSWEAVNGFTKNLFAAFGYRLLIYLFVFLWLGILFWVPLINLVALTFGKAPTARLDELVVCLVLSLLVWLIPYKEIGVPFFMGLLYPVTILAIEAVAVKSLLFSLTGRLSWKGRQLAKPKWRWL
jgi:chlorobactene glucosyltransferase